MINDYTLEHNLNYTELSLSIKLLQILNWNAFYLTLLMNFDENSSGVFNK